MKVKKKIIVVSGGFDPIHIGHIRLFKKAKKLGDKLIVVLQPDSYLKKKKGFIFMTYKERKEIIENIVCVDEVIKCIDRDMTTCKTLEKIKPDVFANGGDRNFETVPETDVCKKLGIKTVFNVGGGKIQSSSKMIKKLINK